MNEEGQLLGQGQFDEKTLQSKRNSFSQGSRQFYSPYQGQFGYGSIQGINSPYADSGVGFYQYGQGLCRRILILICIQLKEIFFL
jgi:hypothetical protein